MYSETCCPGKTNTNDNAYMAYHLVSDPYKTVEKSGNVGARSKFHWIEDCQEELLLNPQSLRAVVKEYSKVIDKKFSLKKVLPPEICPKKVPVDESSIGELYKSLVGCFRQPTKKSTLTEWYQNYCSKRSKKETKKLTLQSSIMDPYTEETKRVERSKLKQPLFKMRHTSPVNIPDGQEDTKDMRQWQLKPGGGQKRPQDIAKGELPTSEVTLEQQTAETAHKKNKLVSEKTKDVIKNKGDGMTETDSGVTDATTKTKTTKSGKKEIQSGVKDKGSKMVKATKFDMDSESSVKETISKTKTTKSGKKGKFESDASDATEPKPEDLTKTKAKKSERKGSKKTSTSGGTKGAPETSTSNAMGQKQEELTKTKGKKPERKGSKKTSTSGGSPEVKDAVEKVKQTKVDKLEKKGKPGETAQANLTPASAKGLPEVSINKSGATVKRHKSEEMVQASKSEKAESKKFDKTILPGLQSRDKFKQAHPAEHKHALLEDYEDLQVDPNMGRLDDSILSATTIARQKFDEMRAIHQKEQNLKLEERALIKAQKKIEARQQKEIEKERLEAENAAKLAAKKALEEQLQREKEAEAAAQIEEEEPPSDEKVDTLFHQLFGKSKSIIDDLSTVKSHDLLNSTMSTDSRKKTDELLKRLELLLCQPPEQEQDVTLRKSKHKKTKKLKKKKISTKTIHSESDDACECEICKFMNRRRVETETPLIKQMREEERKRELREYYKQMQKRACNPFQTSNNNEEYETQPIFPDMYGINERCENTKGTFDSCLNSLRRLKKYVANPK